MNNHLVPQGVWRDGLRASDDGSFSRVTITNKATGSDPIDYH